MRKRVIYLILFVLLINITFYPFLYSSYGKRLKKLNVIQNSTEYRLLKLLLKTFIGTKDLKSAYEVALYGKRLYPKDPFWYKKLIQISLWNSRPDKALKFLLELYHIKKEKALIKKIIDLAVALNKFDIAIPFIEKELNEGKSYNLEKLYYIYLKTGKTSKLIFYLKKIYKRTQNKKVLYHLVNLLYSSGRVDEAYKYGTLLLKTYPLDPKDVILLSHILFTKKQPEKAFLVLKKNAYLLKHYPKNKTFVEYHRLLSDLGWSFKDFDTAIKSSKILYQLGKAKVEDYIRLYTYYFSKSKYEKSFYFAYKGFQKYKLSFFLEVAIESLYREKKFKKIIDLLKNKKKILKENQLLFSRYTISFAELNEWKKVKHLLSSTSKKRIPLDLIEQLIYISVENSNQKFALYIKNNFSFLENKIPRAFCLLYFFLQDGRKALNLFYRFKRKASISDKVFYSDLLELYGRFDEAQKLRFDLFKKLSQKGLSSKNEILSYLRLGAYFLNYNEYYQLLKKYKKMLSPKVYNNLYLSYLLQQKRQTALQFLWKRYKIKLSPWMYLNLALWENDKSFQAFLLKKYGKILPIRDRITALERTGNISQSIEYAFKGLEANREDYILYKRFRDLIIAYNPRFDFQTSIVMRRDSKALSSNFYFLFPIKFSTRIFLKGNFLTMLKKDKTFITKTPSVQNIQIGIKNISDIGKFNFSLGVLNSQGEENFQTIFKLEKCVKSKTTIKIKLGRNIYTDETVLLQYGGMKDTVKLDLFHEITNRLYFYTSPSYNYYYSSDRKYLGKSLFIYNELSYKLRIRYPDYTFTLYTMHGIYHEKTGDKGKIKNLSPFTNPKVLPDSFNELGIRFFFGLENYESYVRCWRPFLSLQAGFNDKTNFNDSFSAGIGGSLFGQDNFSIIFKYTKSYKGAAEEIKTFQVHYILFFN